MIECPNCSKNYPGHFTPPLRCNCGTIIEFEQEPYLAPEPKPMPSPNRNTWPKWALSLKRLRKDGETGVGDTAQRVASWFGGELFKRFSAKIGMPCQCSNRQNNWNKQFPYE